MGTGVGLRVLNMLTIVSVRVHVPLQGTAGSQNRLAIVQSQRAVWPSGDKVGILSEREWGAAWPTEWVCLPLWQRILVVERSKQHRKTWMKEREMLNTTSKMLHKALTHEVLMKYLFTFFAVKQNSVCSVQGAHSDFFIWNPKQKITSGWSLKFGSTHDFL